MLVQYRKQRKARLTVGAGWKTFKDDGAGERTVLFWSGGKDSFLTLRALQRRSNKAEGRGLREHGPERITLLTTFDGKTGKIPFQDTKVCTITAVATTCKNVRVAEGSVIELFGKYQVTDATELPLVPGFELRFPPTHSLRQDGNNPRHLCALTETSSKPSQVTR